MADKKSKRLNKREALKQIIKMIGLGKNDVKSLCCERRKARRVARYGWHLNDRGIPQWQYLCDCGSIYFTLPNHSISYSLSVGAVLGDLEDSERIHGDPTSLKNRLKVEIMLGVRKKKNAKKVKTEFDKENSEQVKISGELIRLFKILAR